LLLPIHQAFNGKTALDSATNDSRAMDDDEHAPYLYLSIPHFFVPAEIALTLAFLLPVLFLSSPLCLGAGPTC
jgi:hypothetical protein